jgi:hypothetical protein
MIINIQGVDFAQDKLWMNCTINKIGCKTHKFAIKLEPKMQLDLFIAQIEKAKKYYEDNIAVFSEEKKVDKVIGEITEDF